MTETTGTNSNAPKRSESDVYDRQIRLWGAEAQAKMSKANVLYLHVTGVSSEVLKNLVLAGIRATICDSRPYPDAVLDTPSFFLSNDARVGNDDKEEPAAKKKKYGTVADVVQPAVEDLNPLLGACNIVTTSPLEWTQDFLAQFSIVVASRISMSTATQLAQRTTAAGGKFYMADTFGLQGAAILDLGDNHTYRPEQGKKLLDPTVLKPRVELADAWKVPLADAVNRFHKTPPPVWMRYRSLLEYVERTKNWPSTADENKNDQDEFARQVRAWIQETSPSLLDHEVLSETSLRELAQVATSEVAPVCAVLGGIIGNEVIKAISGKGEPANNTILCDGLAFKTWNFLVQPKKKAN